MEPQPAQAASSKSSTAATATESVDRFCRQCLQLEPFPDLDFPPGPVLREHEAQETLHHVLCDGGRPLPARYRLRVLKELVKRIEEAVEDWDEHVSPCLSRLFSLVGGLLFFFFLAYFWNLYPVGISVWKKRIMGVKGVIIASPRNGVWMFNVFSC